MQRFIVLCLATTIAHSADTTTTLLDHIEGDMRRLPLALTTEPILSIAASTIPALAIVWSSGSDAAVQAVVQRSHSSVLDGVARAGNTLGELWSGVGLSCATIAVGAIAGSEHTTTTGRQMLEALACAGAVTTVLKYTIGRARPDRNRGESFFAPFRMDDGQWSFPSGHATVAAAVAGVVLARSRTMVFDVAAIIGTATTAFARVWSNRHWTSDVLAGMFIGGSIGYSIGCVADLSSHVMVYPIHSGIGIALQW